MIVGGLAHEGITSIVLAYLEAIDQQGIEIHLGVAGKTEQDCLERAQALKIPLHHLPSRNRKPAAYLAALIKLVKQERYDIVHVHGNSATLALDMLGAKLGGCQIRIAHAHSSSCTHPWMNRMVRPCFERLYTDGVACSTKAGEWMFGTRPFFIAPNGKNIERFLFNASVRETVRKEMGLEEQIILGHVGGFQPSKNHDFLIQVFRELVHRDKRYRLWLIGEENELQNALKTKVKNYGLKESVCFLGFRPDVERYLCAMDAMIFPSLYEGLPNVVIEWQIAGLPCLLSDTITRECAATDLVQYLPLSAGADAWADAVQAIRFSNREENQQAICTAITEAGFDIKADAERLKRHYLQLLEKGIEK